MFFKSLELFGFKSFAVKTKVDFEAGVTAIVGPNGCGKSNIADAIKWVLGEQSVRSMRGVSMEDVIFHGADNIPAIGFAEASLTISNQNKLLALDYEEITITRRIFRSGESEYLINKIPVRLRDITELLMGTGLGMRSYSLMEQGRVDQILSSKPEERRAIFEEASGITKYKSRKEEALRKLERTGENLQRLADIIVEVGRQIKSMERQVSKARRYKQEFERLKEYELKVSQYQFRNLKKERQQLEDKTRELQKNEASLASKMNSASQNLEKAKQDLSSVEERISAIQAENYEVCAAIKTANNKIALDQERIEELTRRKSDSEQQIQDLEKKIVATAERIKEARTQMQGVEQEKQAKLSFVEEKEESINKILSFVKEAQKKVTEDKMQEMEVITQQARARNEATKLTANLANFNARLRRLNVETQRSEQELNSIKEKHEERLKEVESLHEQSKHTTREIWDLKSNLDAQLEKKHKLNFRLEEFSHQIASRQSSLNFLKEITKKHEGFSRGVRSILAAIDNQNLKIESISGVVANLVQVLPQYQIPIEMALGENAQAFVVESTQAASDAINYLKSEDKGRARFICLDSLNLERVKDITLKATLGKACEFVKTEPKYQKVLAYLLANTFIVQDSETARQILKDTNASVKLVTLNGEILTKTSITGGNLPRNSDSSLLGRAERITKAEAELERIKKERDDLGNLQAAQESEVKEIEDQIHQREPELNKLKISLANKESEKVNIEEQRKRLEDETSVLKMEIDETAEQIEQLRTEEKNLNQELMRQKRDQNELQDRIQSHQNLIKEKDEERQNTLLEIAEAKAEAQGLDRGSEDAQRRLGMLLDSEAEQNMAKQAQEQELRDTAIKIEQRKQERTELELQTKDLSQSKLELEEALNQIIKQRQGFSATIQDLEERSRASQKELDVVREKKAMLQVRLTESSYKQDTLKDRMQQNYRVDLEDILDETAEIQPVEPVVFDEINRLKAKLEGMGPVNLVAIDENDQLQQRYSFLTSQQEDLVGAQESLRRAIAQINQTARKVFAETFQRIQVSFREYFRILFGGGDARLILIEENNILESGIEIVVRPPGKKLQNISLLSGGEKALTAIALLFAIFKVKPSPFCILDEVDAPLDEANIDRFTNLLSEFIKTSQFIIITHNKKTINMADIMYGITMEKSGISKIVSVRFTQDEESPAREVAQIEG